MASRILLPADSIRLGPDIADFVVYPASVELPQAGLMGVLLEKGEKGVRISGVVDTKYNSMVVYELMIMDDYEWKTVWVKKE